MFVLARFKKLFITAFFTFCLSFIGISNTTFNNALPNKKVNDIVFDGTHYWIASDIGVIQVNTISETPTLLNTRNTSVPVNTLVDAGNYVIVGLEDKGLYRMHKKDFTFEGLNRETIGRPTIESLISVSNFVYIKTNEGFYKRATNGSIQQLSKTDFESILSKEKGVLNFRGDTLMLSGLPFLGYSSNNAQSLLVNDNFQLFEYNNKIFSYSFKTKQISQLALESKIENIKKIGEKYISVGESGIKTISIPWSEKASSDPKLKILSIRFNGEAFENGSDMGYTPEGIFKISLEASDLGLDREIKYGFSKDGKTWNWTNSSELLVKDISYEDETIKVAAKNIRGQETPALEVKYSMASPAEDQMWNWIIGISAILIYTVFIVWLAIRKKNKDIAVLEEALLEKTNKLNQIEKSKYGLVDEKKVKI